jgi:wyosine [tRNA(Phe)-imidazoG37] synthetase (radical SAM superfamily)
MPEITAALREAYRRHERRWAANLYVYAVVSRRSRGLSVGINLNPGKECNFDCVYCQVDRRVPPRTRTVDLAQLRLELDGVLGAAADGSLYAVPPFSTLSPEARRVRDIAFSGDGEPTTYPRFREAVAIVADARLRFDLADSRIVLITDAAYLSRPSVREALEALTANGGEVWAKLDAGTERYFRLVDRPNVPLRQVLDGILDTARRHPVVIQTLWMNVEGAGPPGNEVAAYCDRLNEVRAAGGQVKSLQLYTIARKPAEPWATPLSDEDLDRLADVVRQRVPVPVETFYGVTP